MRRTRWCQPDYPEVNPSSSKCLTNSTNYKGPLLLDNNFKQSLLDLFISFKSTEVFMYKRPRVDIIAKEAMVDWSAYQEVKLDTKLLTRFLFMISRQKSVSHVLSAQQHPTSAEKQWSSSTLHKFSSTPDMCIKKKSAGADRG